MDSGRGGFLALCMHACTYIIHTCRKTDRQTVRQPDCQRVSQSGISPCIHRCIFMCTRCRCIVDAWYNLWKASGSWVFGISVRVWGLGFIGFIGFIGFRVYRALGLQDFGFISGLSRSLSLSLFLSFSISPSLSLSLTLSRSRSLPFYSPFLF